MGHEFYVSTAGAMARLRELEILSNNLANANTVGYKRDRTVFEAALEYMMRNDQGEVTPGEAGLSFVKTSFATPDMSQGTMLATGKPLDVALEGRGLFEIETPNGPRYTRAGSFLVNQDRRLVTPDGRTVMGEGGPIEINERPVQILASGDVVDDLGEILGRLRVVSFDESELEKEGSSLFRARDGAVAQPVDGYRLAERMLEGSNVQPVRALAALMVVQRSFDASLQALSADDEMTQQLIREVSA